MIHYLINTTKFGVEWDFRMFNKQNFKYFKTVVLHPSSVNVVKLLIIIVASGGCDYILYPNIRHPGHHLGLHRHSRR